jgi:hypothetical protein
MNYRWVGIRSWHVLTPRDNPVWGDTYLTLCGRVANGPVFETVPPGRTCESCLRIAVKRSDVG